MGSFVWKRKSRNTRKKKKKVGGGEKFSQKNEYKKDTKRKENSDE